MSAPPFDVVLLGGCHVDVIARSAGAFQAGTSCPGTVVRRAGGVARNVSVLLASAGLSVGLVGIVGMDADARSLGEGLAVAGVTPALTPMAGARTGTYVAVHDQTGELVAAVSDLGIYDRFSVSVVETAGIALGDGLVFADANLPAETLGWLAARVGRRMVFDAISRAKAPRLRGLVGSGALILANLVSASSLAGQEFGDPRDAARWLGDAGARAAVVTAGSRPIAVLDRGAVGVVPVVPAVVADVTGAGDALAAGTLAGLVRGWPLPRAVAVGALAAAGAVSVAGAMDRLPDAVTRALRE